MSTIKLAVSVLFLIALSGCGGDDDSPKTTSPAATISILAADIVDASGSKIKTLSLDGSIEGFEIHWKVNTRDLYYVEFFAGTQTAPHGTRLLGRTCAASDPGDLYGCKNSGQNRCEVTAPNRVSCEISGTRPQNSAPHRSATHLTAKACTFGFLEDTCATRTLDVQLLQSTSETPESGDSTRPVDEEPVTPEPDEPVTPGDEEPTSPETENPTVPGNGDGDNEEVDIEAGTAPTTELGTEKLIPPAVPQL